MIEKKGVILEIYSNYGYILDEDKIKYYFSFVEFLDNIDEIKLNIKVVFKPQIITVDKVNIYKAILISKR